MNACSTARDLLRTSLGASLLKGVWLAFIIALGVGPGAMIGTQPGFFSELFGKSSRYSAISLGHELASVFAGGLSPLIATALLAATQSSWPISLYLVVLGCITLAAVYCSRETVQRDARPRRPRGCGPPTPTTDPHRTPPRSSATSRPADERSVPRKAVGGWAAG